MDRQTVLWTDRQFCGQADIVLWTDSSVDRQTVLWTDRHSSVDSDNTYSDDEPVSPMLLMQMGEGGRGGCNK